MVAIFFLLTVWHWGSADAPAPGAIPLGWWVAHSVVRGLLLFAIPAWWWPTETAEIVNGLLAFTGAAPVSPATFATASVSLCSLVGLGHLALWGYYASFHRDLLRPELLEVLVLSALLLALPPRLSVAVYFIFWHSLQHVLRLNTWLGYRHQQPTTADLLAQLQFFLRRAAPLLVVSCVALLALGYSLAHHLPDATAWFSLALIAASIVVTLPHALLVTLVMDAAQWQRPKPQVL
jgi:Brp/Blh family beta-carotene 15,15'-monooxygenase